MGTLSSRRALLAGIATAPLLGVPVLSGGVHPDAELVRLEIQLTEARARLGTASERERAADDLFVPPAQPEILIATNFDLFGGLPHPEAAHCIRGRTWSLRQIEKLRTSPPHQAYYVPGGFRVCERAARRRAEIIAAHDAYQAEIQAASDACGLTAAEAEYVARTDEVERIGEAILATRATTLVGLAVKARAHIARYGAPEAEDLAELSSESLALSIIVDIAAMGAQS